MVFVWTRLRHLPSFFFLFLDLKSFPYFKKHKYEFDFSDDTSGKENLCHIKKLFLVNFSFDNKEEIQSQYVQVSTLVSYFISFFFPFFFLSPGVEWLSVLIMHKFVDEKWFEMLPVLNVPSPTILKISMQLQFMAQKVQWVALGKTGEYLRNVK